MRRYIILLIFILVLAAFLRLWQLDVIPPGLYPDEAINGNEAITNPGQIFYHENNGREGLFINLIAFSFSIFGISIWSLKIVPAIIGILTVLGLYLLALELFQISGFGFQVSKNIALLSSFFLAVSFWHINFSRIGFRAILIPFILVFLFYFLFKGFRTKKILNFIISGIFFGLGFHTYISYRLIVIALPLIFILWWLIYKKQNLQKKFLLFTGCWLLVAFIIAMPIGIYFLQNPQDFIGRASGVSIFSAENPIKEFGKSLILHLGMFNFYGDGNWRHNFAGSPMLFWPIGILFLIGFFISFREIFKKSNYQNKNYQVLSIFCFLFSVFFAMLLPGVLTREGLPHALRIIGVIPVVYIFAGLGGWIIYQWFNQNVKKTKRSSRSKIYGMNKKLLVLASIAFLLMTGIIQFDKYFVKWARLPEVEGAFSKNYVEIGNYLNSLPLETQKYVIVNQGGVPVPFPDGLPMPAQTLMFIERTKFGELRSTYLLPEDLEKIMIPVVYTENNKKIVIIPLAFEQNLFQRLKQIFPQGEIQEQNQVWFYKINL